MNRFRVAVDVGGTFTDFVIFDTETGTARTGKVLSTTQDQARGVLTGLRTEVGALANMTSLVHGNTVGLNAFLERKGARTLFVTTDGYRDVLRLGRGDKDRLFVVRYRKPEPLVPVTDVETVRERLNFDGSVRTALNEVDVERIAERVQREQIATVAVCLLHAYRNPEHELRVRDILLARVPKLSVSLSHEVAPEWREYERSSTTVLNAYVAPAVDRYLNTLTKELDNGGFRSALHIMQSNGGVTTAAVARKLPVHSLLSGPVGGVIGGATLSKELERPNLLCVDMGGTSFDASIIVDGSPNISTQATLERMPVLTPLLDIHTIGAGGGSIATVEAGGLRVGPESAGAEPGPACYRRGGTKPTVTDANALLGRIDPDYFLAGGMPLDVGAAKRAIETVSAPLGLSPVEAATGILAIVNAKMADAMRTLTILKGVDPRKFSLVAFGGAGPMHAAALAEEVGISEVIIPWAPGTFSAWGMLHTDMRRDLVASYYQPAATVDPLDLARRFDGLTSEGDRLLEADDVPIPQRRFTRLVDMRYQGQEYTLTIAMPDGNECRIGALIDSFHREYHTRFGHSTPGAPLDMVALRLIATGKNEWPLSMPEKRITRDARKKISRTVVFDGKEHQAAIVHRSTLADDDVVKGPAIIEEPTSTTVVPPAWSVRRGPANALLMTAIGRASQS